jgi:hypothetical protein
MSDPVFINCPFDTGYNTKFRAIIFSIVSCGFHPRCALELDNAVEGRLAKILRIVKECRLSVHDISRTQLDEKTRLPRFNMPFELGLFFGAKEFGGIEHAGKSALVLDSTSFRYRKFISDLSGHDISSHRNSINELITLVRNWLSQHRATTILPGDRSISDDFRRFARDFPRICRDAGIRQERIQYNDFVNIMKIWIAKQARP